MLVLQNNGWTISCVFISLCCREICHSFIWVPHSWHYKPGCMLSLWRNVCLLCQSCEGDSWVTESPFPSEGLIKAVCVRVVLLKCLWVRHRTNVIDERVTRPLVCAFLRVSHNIPLHHLAESSWPKLSGTTVLAMDLWRGGVGGGTTTTRHLAASAHPSNMSMYEDSQSSRR